MGRKHGDGVPGKGPTERPRDGEAGEKRSGQEPQKEGQEGPEDRKKGGSRVRDEVRRGEGGAGGGKRQADTKTQRDRWQETDRGGARDGEKEVNKSDSQLALRRKVQTWGGGRDSGLGGRAAHTEPPPPHPHRSPPHLPSPDPRWPPYLRRKGWGAARRMGGSTAMGRGEGARRNACGGAAGGEGSAGPRWGRPSGEKGQAGAWGRERQNERELAVSPGGRPLREPERGKAHLKVTMGHLQRVVEPLNGNLLMGRFYRWPESQKGLRLGSVCGGGRGGVLKAWEYLRVLPVSGGSSSAFPGSAKRSVWKRGF